jgi:hypothetical protein
MYKLNAVVLFVSEHYILLNTASPFRVNLIKGPSHKVFIVEVG